jgi:hypothetical protein
MRRLPTLHEHGPRNWTKRVRPTPKSYHLQCCDCALVHEFQFFVVDGQVEFRLRQKPRLTARVRAGK